MLTGMIGRIKSLFDFKDNNIYVTKSGMNGSVVFYAYYSGRVIISGDPASLAREVKKAGYWEKGRRTINSDSDGLPGKAKKIIEEKNLEARALRHEEFNVFGSALR